MCPAREQYLRWQWDGQVGDEVADLLLATSDARVIDPVWACGDCSGRSPSWSPPTS